MAQYTGNKKYRSVKSVYLTADQAELFARSLEMIAEAVESGQPIKLVRRRGKQRVIEPVKALRNQAAWLRRTLDEQNGGYHLVTAWDYQEER